MAKYPQQLGWIDFETTGLPTYGGGVVDYSKVHVLEIAIVITDFDLNPQVGYEAVIKMTPEAASELRSNEYVKSMHTDNGLIRESVREATLTLTEAEDEILDMLKTKTTFEKGEFMIAGSGVAAFDHPLIKAKMPRLAEWFVYYPFDTGIERRVSEKLAGRPLINNAALSYNGANLHRAMGDVQWALREATAYQAWYREAFSALDNQAVVNEALRVASVG